MVYVFSSLVPNVFRYMFVIILESFIIFIYDCLLYFGKFRVRKPELQEGWCRHHVYRLFLNRVKWFPVSLTILNKVYTFPSKRFLIKIYAFLCVSKCFFISKKIIEFLFALLICVRNQYLLSHLYLCRILLEFLSLSGRVLKKSTWNLVKTSLDWSDVKENLSIDISTE